LFTPSCKYILGINKNYPFETGPTLYELTIKLLIRWPSKSIGSKVGIDVRVKVISVRPEYVGLSTPNDV
jgi:hypothetical protein